MEGHVAKEREKQQGGEGKREIKRGDYQSHKTTQKESSMNEEEGGGTFHILISAGKNHSVGEKSPL